MEINNKYKAYNAGKKDKKGMKSSDFYHADVLSPEAIWLLPEYKMHGESHTVYRLAVHLPGEKENVYSQESQGKPLVKHNAVLCTLLHLLNETNSIQFLDSYYVARYISK